MRCLVSRRHMFTFILNVLDASDSQFKQPFVCKRWRSLESHLRRCSQHPWTISKRERPSRTSGRPTRFWCQQEPKYGHQEVGKLGGHSRVCEHNMFLSRKETEGNQQEMKEKIQISMPSGRPPQAPPSSFREMA